MILICVLMFISFWLGFILCALFAANKIAELRNRISELESQLKE